MVQPLAPRRTKNETNGVAVRFSRPERNSVPRSETPVQTQFWYLGEPRAHDNPRLTVFFVPARLNQQKTGVSRQLWNMGSARAVGRKHRKETGARARDGLEWC